MVYSPQRPAANSTATGPWWRGAVIYQIYPRSFQDSNGDGIGDLPGITARLPYVASLGVDVIWLSPFYPSPMEDFGYDIADHCQVDPMFGTLADFDELLGVAHGLGLRVIIDLVLSHTSDRHPWFVTSRAGRNAPRHDWYVWADPKPDGTPPNNWLSVFGGPAWQWDARRCQYYLHNFLSSQPDLDLHNPKVQDALLEVARFWLERGVDGFRLDAVNFYCCDRQLRDNPALATGERDTLVAPRVNPYTFQDHRYDKNQPQTVGFLRRFRALLDEYPAIAAVGEVGDSQHALELVVQYTAGDRVLQMCYSFQFFSAALDATSVVEILGGFEQAAPDGWPCWAFSNHDVARHASRWRLPRTAQKLVASLLLCMRGSVCLYQGEELGLPQAELELPDMRDPYGIRFWPEYPGRDGCRTPMVWTPEPPHGGFSDGQPWLPVPPAHLPLAVAAQAGDPQSVLNHYRSMLVFRRSHPALVAGRVAELSAERDVVSFTRTAGAETLHCAFNLSAETVRVALPHGAWQPLEVPGFATTVTERDLVLPPWQAHIARRP